MKITAVDAWGFQFLKMFNFCRTNAYIVKIEIDNCINTPFYIFKGGVGLLINLQLDYKKIMIEKIKESGVRIPDDFDDNRMIITYYSYLRKKAFAGPHKIVKSKSFICPPKVKKGFEKLENIIRNGGDITPYFNRIASDLAQFDDMFADWGILHFHLGDEFIKGEHLVKRDKLVLFAYLERDTVYFINIYNHHYWSDSSVIQEMYDNWPELINKFIFKDVDAITIPIDKHQRRKLREHGILIPVEIKNDKGKNIVLMPPGMGLTSARTSVSDTRLFQNTMNDLGLIQLDLVSNEKQIIESMELQGIEVKQELSFELIKFDQEHLYLLDKNHKYPITVRHA